MSPAQMLSHGRHTFSPTTSSRGVSGYAVDKAIVQLDRGLAGETTMTFGGQVYSTPVITAETRSVGWEAAPLYVCLKLNLDFAKTIGAGEKARKEFEAVYCFV